MRVAVPATRGRPRRARPRVGVDAASSPRVFVKRKERLRVRFPVDGWVTASRVRIEQPPRVAVAETRARPHCPDAVLGPAPRAARASSFAAFLEQRAAT